MNKIVSDSTFHGELVNYYEKFFIESRSVDINQEVKYIFNKVQKYFSPINSILDVGCGTGYHAELFSKYCNRILGLDISQDMIGYAIKHHKRPNIEYLCKDVQSFHSNINFDVALALSHVVGYQLDNNSLEEMLIAINKSLVEGGILFLNFYYEPAIYTNKLKAQYKEVHTENEIINRFSNADLISYENALLLKYIYLIEKDPNKKEEPSIIKITEKMRFYTKLEMDFYLDKAGFEPINYWDYMQEGNVSGIDWNVCVLARKVKPA